MDKKIAIVGIGMDGANTLTAEAKETIENAELLIGAERMLKPFKYLETPVFTSYVSGDIKEYIDGCEYEKIAVLMSGDCGFYSGAEKLIRLLDGYACRIISGISSPVYFCNKLGVSWQDVHFVSLHGVSGNVVRNVRSHEKTFFLLGGSVTPRDICLRLCEYRLDGVRVSVGENLALENERICEGKPLDLLNESFEKLCVMLVRNDKYEKGITSCISDDEFVRGKMPMTKAEVRCVCVSRLEIAAKSVCWDIGCGTGSVSVEMAMRCPDGTVYAVEKNAEALLLTDENKHKFGCDNIEIVSGSAVDVIGALPAPDCVFIGGSGGELETVIKAAADKNLNVKIVITAVSLETLNESAVLLEENGFASDITQIAVTRTKKVGSHTMLAAENPIFVIKGEKK